MTSRSLRVLRAADRTMRYMPLGGSVALARMVGARIGPRIMPAKARQLQRHLERVAETNGTEEPASATDGFASYSRYWTESFALPHSSTTEVDRGFSFVGYDRIEQVRAGGKGPILVIPHLGGWEWAAAWMGRVARVPVTAVVEALEPPDVFEWFRDLRSSYGVNVVSLGPSAFAEITRAVAAGHVVCLLADRDIAGTGVEVEFFGETTTMPIGPAILSSRTGSPVLPTAVYFNRDQRVTMVGEPIAPVLAAGPEARAEGGEGDRSTLKGRRRYHGLTQRYAKELEQLISRAPDQWHLLEPNWPSDHNRNRRLP